MLTLKIKEQIERVFSIEERMEIMESVSKGEVIISQSLSKIDKKQASEMVAPYLTALEEILNQIIVMMGYPMQLNQWNDTKPLQIMIETMPNLDQTKWYQRKIEEVMS